jgi:hypothetical protein
MLHGFGPAPGHVAVAAGLPGRFADVLGHGNKVHTGVRHARRSGGLFIGVRGIVADKAVDSGFIREVKSVVGPTVTSMTGCATSLVAFDGYSEIVHGIGCLAAHDLLCTICSVRRRPAPQPVGRTEHVLALLFMTAQACRSYFPGLGVGPQFDKLLVIGSIPAVAAQAIHRPLFHVLMAGHALEVVSRLEAPPAPGCQDQRPFDGRMNRPRSRAFRGQQAANGGIWNSLRPQEKCACRA